MKSYAFLFWAYAVIWLALSGFLLFLIVRLGRIERRLAGLEQDPAGAQGSRRS